MHDHDTLLTQSKELVLTAKATVAHSRTAAARATKLVTDARELVQRSQDTADARHADRLALVPAGR